MEQSTTYQAGYFLGTILFIIAFYLGVPALGYYVGKRLTRRRDDGVAVRWPFRVALALVAISLIGQCSAPKAPRSGVVAAAPRG